MESNITQIFPIGTDKEKTLLNSIEPLNFENMFINWVPKPLFENYINYFKKSDFANFLLGLQYEYGILGVEKDLNKAYEIYKNSAAGNTDYYSMYRMYIIHLRDYAKFNIERDRNLEKFYLFKTYTFNQFSVIKNFKYFMVKLDLNHEIRNHIIYEDVHGDNFLKLINYLKNNDFYNISTDTLNLISLTFKIRFNIGDIEFFRDFSEFKPDFAEKYDIEFLYKLGCIMKRTDNEEAKKYFEVCEQKKYYKAYLDYGELLYDLKEEKKALEVFEEGYSNYNHYCLFDYFDLFFNKFEFGKFNELSIDERFKQISKLIDILLIDFSFGNLYSLFEFFYLRNLCDKHYELGELIEQKYKEQIKELVYYLNDAVDNKTDLIKSIFTKDLGIAEFNLNLGFIYLKGIKNIVEPDLNKSIKHLEKSLELSSSKNYSRFVYSFIFKAKKKLFEQKLITENELENTKKELYKYYQESFLEEDESSESSSSFLYYMGVITKQGLGTKKDLISSFSFFKKAANIEHKSLGIGSIVSFYRKYKSKNELLNKDNFKDIDSLLKSLSITDDEGYGINGTICCVCYQNQRDKVIIPCRHSFCSECSEYLKQHKMKCPICRGKIILIGDIKNDDKNNNKNDDDK